MTDATASVLAEALRDRYRLERELGRGGMATVWLAHDLKHDRPVALKVLRPELTAALGPERFLREIRLTARLQHPHILPLHDSGECHLNTGAGAAPTLYYVMPYIEGESLRQRLARRKQLPLAEALVIAREAADALDYAHGRGIVHRDIKPENILLSGPHALVADFGVARAIEMGGDRLTETGLAIGTAAYMSPEQATGRDGIDHRADVYALSCVLYEMLTGEPPYTGPTTQAIVAKAMAAPAPSVRHVRPELPEAVDRAILRGLAKAPADRFPTAGELVRAAESGPGGRRRLLGVAAAVGLLGAGNREP